MEPIKAKNETFDLEFQIEELEGRIAPDGGETVLPVTDVTVIPDWHHHH